MAVGRADPGHHHPLADLPLGAEPARFRRVEPGGGATVVERPLVAEVPVAIEVAGVAYAVMMATPIDLEDFVLGFCLAERLADVADQIDDIDIAALPDGYVARVSGDERLATRTHGRVRHRVSDSACGLCGVESIEQAMRPLPRVPAGALAPAAAFRATGALRSLQPLGRETGAAHAAAACAADGAIRLVREDVGRHNAFDKLVGAMARARLGWDGGFALVTSRLSYEIVEKAAVARCPAIAAISAPTALAARRAAQAGIRLIALARPDALLAAVGLEG